MVGEVKVKDKKYRTHVYQNDPHGILLDPLLSCEPILALDHYSSITTVRLLCPLYFSTEKENTNL
ncbi:hypothetical protein CRE_30110 [Caenorhabditis remanei]|uniref:Uncharacterized protein n=1 Tax=Caenorhabditis remanei TaxID=31234 RepID=E3MYI7_CAERE|nr:hypothetical protein CRE_30110 [Caenorhabditis remanei]